MEQFNPTSLMTKFSVLHQLSL